ncbi:MAG: flagellin [Thermoproteota archaeon]
MVSVIMSEGIVLIASVIVAAGLSGMAINKMGVFQSAFSASTDAQKDVILTRLKVIYATNSSSTQVNIWVKNVGVAPIDTLESVDVYFGELGSVQRIPYDTGSTPQWTFGNNPDLLWKAGGTLEIEITLDNALQEGAIYTVMVTAPNGVSDDYIFSI